MDPAQALTDLTEISSQIESAALFDANGSVVASTLGDAEAARVFVMAAHALLDAAEEARSTAGTEPLAQLEAATLDGSVFVVRDAARAVVAVTRPEPTAGLIFYDLKSCLRAAAAEEGDAKPRPRARQARTPSSAQAGTEDSGAGSA